MRRYLISESDFKNVPGRILDSVAEGKAEYLVVMKKQALPVRLSQGEHIVVPEPGNEIYKSNTLAGRVQRKLTANDPKMYARRCSECGTNMLWDRTDKRPPVCDKCYGKA